MRTLWMVSLLSMILLPAVAPAADVPQPTFSKDIAPIVFENCAACHHPGEVAPFSLLSYSDVKKRAKQIVQVTGERFMPPWKSLEGHGSFVDERRLTKDEIALIARWVEQGAIEGDTADLPPQPQFKEGFKLGKPDIVITMPEAYEIPADGPDIYRNFVYDVEIPVGKYIKAAEYLPQNRRVVHHAVLAMDNDGRARKDDEADPAPGYPGSLNLPGQLFPGSLAAWTPGRDALPLPDGLSLPWKAGAGLILQLHLHPSGKPESEQSSIGLYLTDEPPKRSMVDLVLIDQKIDIPPGEKAYRTRDAYTLPIDMELYGLFPHMHMIGREIRLTAHPPESEPVSLLWINDWDFNWQNFYQYAEPVKLPVGTRIILEAVHDNSADNIRNPSVPPQRVAWGEQTTDEMSAAILQLVPVREGELSKLEQRRVLGGITAEGAGGQLALSMELIAQQALKKFDRDNSGKLDYAELATAAGQDEAAIRLLAGIFDRDGDGALNEAELAKAIGVLGKK